MGSGHEPVRVCARLRSGCRRCWFRGRGNNHRTRSARCIGWNHGRSWLGRLDLLASIGLVVQHDVVTALPHVGADCCKTHQRTKQLANQTYSQSLQTHSGQVNQCKVTDVPDHCNRVRDILPGPVHLDWVPQAPPRSSLLYTTESSSRVAFG